MKDVDAKETGRGVPWSTSTLN